MLKKLFHPQTARLVVSFLLGTLLGSIGINFLYGHKLDSLYLERNALYYQTNQKQKEINNLTNELNQIAKKDAHRRENSDRILKVQVEVENDLRFAQEEVKEEIEKIVDPFIGKSMQWISNNPDLLDTLLKERTIEVKNNSSNPGTVQIQLQLKYIAFLDSTLKIWVLAQERSQSEMN